MGEYMTIINLDKKEIFKIPPYKFWEQLANVTAPLALYWLVTKPTPKRWRGSGWGDIGEYKTLGRWAGDRVVILGDYHPEYLRVLQDPEFVEITIEVLKELADYLEREGPPDLAKAVGKALKYQRRWA